MSIWAPTIVDEVADVLRRDPNHLRDVIHSLRETYYAARFPEETSAIGQAITELLWNLPEVQHCKGKVPVVRSPGAYYDLPMVKTIKPIALIPTSCVNQIGETGES
ncbi:MAG: hypothetical protein U0930_22775 [Pirellulales bacterium]